MDIGSILSFETVLLTVRLAIPIGLAAVGATVCERIGIINLGVEGMMLMGALGAVVGSFFTGSPWFGVLCSILAGGLIGFLHAVLSIKYKANQSVSGVGINMMSSGLTIVIMKAIWDNDGISGNVKQVSNISVPVLKDIPVIGLLFNNQTPFLYISVVVVALAWYCMYKTPYGLRLRAIGDHPKAVETAGVNVNMYRYTAVVISGALAGLGGSYLSIVQNNLFVREMVAGRGFLAIAANIFGGWNPLGSFMASLLFAFAQALRLNLADLNIPDQFIQMLPYLITFIVLVAVGQKAKAPEAMGNIA